MQQSTQYVNNKRFKHQEGMTVLGTVVAITIAAVVIAATILLAHRAIQDNSTNDAGTLVQTMSTKIQEFYASSQDYSAITTASVIDSGVVPQSDINGTSIMTPWYSSSASSVVTVAPGATSGFTITLTDIPVSACNGVGAKFLNDAGASVSANTVAVTTPAALATNCVTSKPATIAITF